MNKHKNLHLPFLRYSRKRKTEHPVQTSLTEDNRFFPVSPMVARTEGRPPKSNNVLATMGEIKRAQFTQMVFCLDINVEFDSISLVDQKFSGT